MGLDKRIGDKFLHPGLDMEGHVFQRYNCFIKNCFDNNVDLSIINNVFLIIRIERNHLLKNNHILGNDIKDMSCCCIRLSSSLGQMI